MWASFAFLVLEYTHTGTRFSSVFSAPMVLLAYFSLNLRVRPCSDRAAMRCCGMRQMGIERRCDASHQKFRAVADRKPVVDHGYGAVGDEALDPRPIDDRGSMIPAVQPGHPGQIDS